MASKKKKLVVDEHSVPRHQHLNIFPLDDCDDSLMIAICSALFEERVKEKYGCLSKDQLAEVYLDMGEKCFIKPVRDEFDSIDRIISQGNCDPKLMDRKHEKVTEIFKKFR